MSEQFQELANKAGYNDQIYEISKEGLNKFAKLIVQECCDKIEREYKYVLGEKSQWAMSQDVQDLLKEHFGIE